MSVRVKLGKTDSDISPVGMGTYYDPGWLVSSKLLKIAPNAEKHINAIRAGIESGLNLIDTAEIYGTENLVSRAISGFEREELFIATKVWPTHFTKDKIKKSCERSLRNLGLKQIDLYQLHFPSRKIDIKETMGAMEELVDQGKIRHIGISNFNLAQMREAIDALKKYEIVSTQMRYSLIRREIERDLIPFCKDNNISVLAYYPLGHGKLSSGRIDNKPIIKKIEEKHGGKTVPQIVLNWFLSKYDFVFPIPRASDPDHVRENAGSIGWEMTPDEIETLEKSLE